MNGYVITDKNQSIWVCKEKNGSYSLTTDRNRALIFDTRPAADMVFKSNLSKLIKSKGVMVKAIDLQIAGATTQVKQEVVVVKEVLSAPSETDTSKYIISVLSDAVGKLNCRHITLTEDLSKCDRQISDVLHYIEFNAGKLNACDGYKAYKLLQDILISRRTVKDELEIIQVVRDKMAFPEDIANIDKRLQESESRHYKPRELLYLFETREKQL